MSALDKVIVWLGGSKRPTSFEVFKGKDGWHWHERASNGQIKSSSEGYASRSNALRAAMKKAKATENARVVIVV